MYASFVSSAIGADCRLKNRFRKMSFLHRRCFDTSFPRGALIYRHPLFQRDRPELMSQMSAGKKKCEVAKPAVSNQASDNREHQPTAQRGLLASGPLLVNPSRLPYYDRISAASERHDTRQLQNNHHRQQQHQNQQRAAAEQYRVATTIHNRMQSNATVRELCFQTLHDRQQQRDWHNSFIRTVPFSGATGQQQQGDISAAAGSAQRVLTLLRLRQLLSRSRTRGQQE